MRVIAPLMSKTASGSVRDVLTFSKKKTIQICRFQRKQKSPGTSQQAPQRADFSFAVCACNHYGYGASFYGATFYGLEMALFTAEAERRGITEPNQCVSEILNN